MTPIRIRGGAELANFLNQFPVEIEKKVLRNALRAGAKVVQQEAKTLVRRKSGKTAKAIKITTRTSGGIVSAKVKLKGPHAFTGWFLEFGVRPHLISVAEEAKPLLRKKEGMVRASMTTVNRRIREGSLKIGDQYVGSMVHHPGHRAFPFMRPALDRKHNEAIAAMGDYIANWMNMGSLRAPVLAVEDDGDDA